MAINPLAYLFDPHQRIYGVFLLSSLLIAAFVLWRNPAQRRVNLSKKLWLHPSAIVDYQYFVVAIFLKTLLIFPVLISAHQVALATHYFLLNTYGLSEISGISYSQAMVLFTLTLFVVSDFTRYWLHRLLHAVPFLWAFHQVHHSAKVLNPLTFYRVHPVESALFGLRYALSVGVVSGVFVYWFGALLDVVDILGVNALGFIGALAASNLRHSHVKIGFGAHLERVFMSPFQHQIHHSKHHTNTNFGGFLSIWDALFRTLTRSSQVSRLKFGLKTSEMPAFNSVFRLILTPFATIFQSFSTTKSKL